MSPLDHFRFTITIELKLPKEKKIAILSNTNLKFLVFYFCFAILSEWIKIVSSFFIVLFLISFLCEKRKLSFTWLILNNLDRNWVWWFWCRALIKHLRSLPSYLQLIGSSFLVSQDEHHRWQFGKVLEVFLQLCPLFLADSQYQTGVQTINWIDDWKRLRDKNKNS